MNNEIQTLPLDDQFALLLHKKIMGKSGSTKRQMKKYYRDKYNKTGVIPKPLLLVKDGIFEGRLCSGRKRVLPLEVLHRFKVMVIASTDISDKRFIFITQKARIIKTYHHYLEEEFHQKLSYYALVHYAKKENLNRYLKQADFEKEINVNTYFNAVDVFDLIQVDGCEFRYIRIKDPQGQWVKLNVIEFYDTGSRYLFCLNAYYSENSENSILELKSFLLCMPFPDKKIRLRPDQAGAFLNLKRPIQELNHKYSIYPDKFYLDPDFAGTYSPKHKVHLETSHRTLHHYEIRFIKHFEDQIVKQEASFAFINNKKTKITVTYLDVGIDEINLSNILENYRSEHNEKKHYFSNNGQTQSWIPEEKLHNWMGKQLTTIRFDPEDVECFMRYAFKKKNASVSKLGTVIYEKRKFTVVIGREKFSHQKSTPVKVSYYNNKLFLFEKKQGGVWIGEAMPQQPSEIPKHIEEKGVNRVKMNEVEQMATFLEKNDFQVNLTELIVQYRQGLTLAKTKAIYNENRKRYDTYLYRLPTDKQSVRIARFSAFLIDCDKPKKLSEPPPYAVFEGE